MDSNKTWFISAGMISISIALLHIVIIFVGAEGYRYFGAGEEMASMAEAGSFVPGALTACIALVFCLFGIYAFSGAGIIRKLPLLKIVLIAVAAIYVLRGLGFFIEVLGIIYNYNVPVRHAVFSFVALATGIIHLTAIIKGWQGLSKISNIK